MPPITAKLIFYAVSAVGVVLLLVRMAWKRKAARRAAQASPAVARSQVAPSPEPPAAPTVPADAARAAPAAESRSTGAVSWGERSLFAEMDPADAIQVPRLEPHEIPLHGSDDCVFGPATGALASLLPESPPRREELKRELRAAGYYQPHAWHNLAAVRYTLLMGSIVFFGVLLLIVPPRLEKFALGALVGCAALGWAFPRLYVRGKSTQRLSEIERAMPDMLDMLNMCVSQGMTVQESLVRVGRQMQQTSPALAREIEIINEQASVGSLDQALENFSDRIDLPEVHSFTTLVIQTDRMGTSISDALAQYSDNMRENLRQRADEKANQATFRLLFPTVMFLMPAVFIFLLGPAIVELSDFFTGGGRAALSRNRDSVDRIRGN